MSADVNVRTVPEALPILLARFSPLNTPVRDPLTPEAGARRAVTARPSSLTSTLPVIAHVRRYRIRRG